MVNINSSPLPPPPPGYASPSPFENRRLYARPRGATQAAKPRRRTQPPPPSPRYPSPSPSLRSRPSLSLSGCLSLSQVEMSVLWRENRRMSIAPQARRSSITRLDPFFKIRACTATHSSKSSWDTVGDRLPGATCASKQVQQ